MIEEREEKIFPQNSDTVIQPKLTKAHFLKPISNPRNESPSPQLPSFKLPSNTNLQLIEKRVSFHGMLGPLHSWKEWVDNLQQTHQITWKKAGIFDAIRASTYHIIRQKGLIIELAENWCSETNTFFFPWGEFTITLEDIMILGGFPVLGTSARYNFGIIESGDQIQKELMGSWRNLKYNNFGHARQTAWMNYFRGKGGELEHVALIALWLSRYVFPTDSCGNISSSVFSLAVNLTRGTKFALASAVLASIYRDLSLLKQKIVNFTFENQDNASKLLLWAPLHLVQVWAWERFPTLCVRPVSIAPGEPRVALWYKIKKPKFKMLRLKMDVTRDEFLWRPYALYLKNWEFPMFYSEEGKWVLVNSEVDEQILSFAKCLRDCKLIGIDCVEQYSPQRVARQFALDQDIPFGLPILSLDSEVALNVYEKPLDGLKIYLPPRLSNGGVTLRYFEWWKLNNVSRCLVPDQEGNGKEIPSCSSSKVVDLVRSGRERPNVNSSSCNVSGLGEDIMVSMQEQRWSADNCKRNDMEEVGKQGNCSNINMVEGSNFEDGFHSQNEIHLSSSFPSCDEAMGLDSVRSSNDMLIDPPSSCERICSHSQDYVANGTVNVNMMTSLTAIKADTENLKSNADSTKDMAAEMGLGCLKVCAGSKSAPFSSSNGQVIGFDLGQSSNADAVMPTEVIPSHESIRSDKNVYVEDQIGVVNVKNLLIGLEKETGQFECNTNDQNKEQVINDSWLNLTQGSNHGAQNEGDGGLYGSEPLLGFQVNTMSGVLVRDERGETTEDDIANKMISSVTDIMIISDEEDSDDYEALEAQGLDMDNRISKLEKMVSALKAAKLKPKAT